MLLATADATDVTAHPLTSQWAEMSNTAFGFSGMRL